MYKSQYGQDQWVDKFLNQPKGIFLDVGAHDGETLSNTWYFEKVLGWSGACFEPIPSVFDKLVKNRSCFCENAAVWKEDCVKKFTIIDGYSEMLSGLTDSCPAQHKSRISNEVSQFSQTVTEIDVRCRDINSILSNLGGRIDFLSIDVEGAEFEILSSVDFSKFDIRVIDCENNYDDANIREFLRSKGFKLEARLGIDDIFVMHKAS